MAFLEQFSEEERSLLVSLPYRAGLWVSRCDSTGEGESGYEELNKLEEIIAEQGKGMFESAFVHEIMAETSARHEDWINWMDNLDSVLTDCAKAVEIVGGKMTEKDLDAYRMNIMAIGLDVAKAFREYGAESPAVVQLAIKVRIFFQTIVRILQRDKSWDHKSVLNISPDEDMALAELSKALHPGT